MTLLEESKVTKKIYEALGHLPIRETIGVLEEIKTDILLNSKLILLDGKVGIYKEENKEEIIGKIHVLHREGNVSVERRVVQDLYIQWNSTDPSLSDWANMLGIGMKFIMERFNPQEPLTIRRTEAWSFMVSCSEWT